VEKGYIYSLRIPGAVMPQYIGQTVNLKNRFNGHRRRKTPCTSEKLFILFPEVEMITEEEIVAVDKCALRFLLSAGERGYIAAYKSHIVNRTSGGIAMDGDANPYFGRKHSEDIREVMRNAWTKSRKVKMAKYLQKNCPWAKFTEDQILEIRNSDVTNLSLAIKYNVSQATIIRIRKHETYTHIGGQAYKSRRHKHGKYAKATK